MAGTLLLIKKTGTDKIDFEKKKKDLKSKIIERFTPFYSTINFHDLDHNGFLVEFRKDDEIKFTRDQTGNWLSYEGTVFALDETKSLNAAELLDLYLSDPKHFPNKLDGHFVIKLYDAAKEAYIVINDFIKNKNNFICETDNYIMFTPFAVTSGIIKKPSLDLHAFNEFMWRYYILSNRSILKDVYHLQPASVYTWQNNKVVRNAYWNWPEKYTKLSFKKAVEKVYDSMKETAVLISEKFGKTCIDFTMGQDTRQVISAFTNQNIKFTSSIFGKSEFYEVKKIKEISSSFGIENHNIQLNKDYTQNLWGNFTKGVFLSSCDQPGYLIGRIMYMRSEQNKIANVALNGVDGHFYKNGLWDEMYTFNLYREPKSFNIGAFLKLRALSKNYSTSIFTPEFITIKDNSENYFRAIIKKSVEDYAESPVSIQVDKFDLEHWLNFGLVANNGGNLISNVISPLLLRRNLEFALQIPVKWKFNLSRFQRALVFKLDPELAKVRTDFAGVNMVPKNIFTIIPFYFRYFYFQSERLRKKMLSKFGFKVVTHLQEAWDYLPLYKKLFAGSTFQEHLNYNNLEIKNIIIESEWKKLLQKYKNTEELNLNEFEYLFKIVSVEYFLKEAKKW